MAHKAFEVIGERAELNYVRSNSWSREIPQLLEFIGRYDARAIKKLLKTKKDVERGRKFGIFQESRDFTTVEGGIEKPALDFIEPVYNTNLLMEEFAKGRIPLARINPDNPILSFHCGVDHLLLEYEGVKNGEHIFTGPLWYFQGVFYNDGNWEVFNKYAKQLKKAGFEVFPVNLG